MRCVSVRTNLHTSSWCPENRANRLCWNLPLLGRRWYAPMSAAWDRYSTSPSSCIHGNKLYGNTIKKVEITPSHISRFTTSQFGFYGIKVTRRLNKTICITQSMTHPGERRILIGTKKERERSHTRTTTGSYSDTVLNTHLWYGTINPYVLSTFPLRYFMFLIRDNEHCWTHFGFHFIRTSLRQQPCDQFCDVLTLSFKRIHGYLWQ